MFIRELGRWTCDRSLRMYLDIMAVANAQLAFALKNHRGLLANIEEEVAQLFA